MENYIPRCYCEVVDGCLTLKATFSPYTAGQPDFASTGHWAIFESSQLSFREIAFDAVTRRKNGGRRETQWHREKFFELCDVTAHRFHRWRDWLIGS